MRVSIISHSYTAAENQKNIVAIANRADVNVVLPRAIRDRIHSDMQLSQTTARVDTELYAPAERPRPYVRDPVVVGYCGRLDEDKGVRELIDAVDLSRGSLGADVRLELLGNGALRDDFVAEAAARPWLTVRDPVPHAQVPEFLRELDVFALPSRVSEVHEEHDAHALLEAMAVGLPCVGTLSGITPEIIGDGSGVLAAPNSAEALHRALAKLIGNPELRRELADRARRKALAFFSLEALADRKSEIYEEILDAG